MKNAAVLSLWCFSPRAKVFRKDMFGTNLEHKNLIYKLFRLFRLHEISVYSKILLTDSGHSRKHISSNTLYNCQMVATVTIEIGNNELVQLNIVYFKEW